MSLTSKLIATGHLLNKATIIHTLKIICKRLFQHHKCDAKTLNKIIIEAVSKITKCRVSGTGFVSFWTMILMAQTSDCSVTGVSLASVDMRQEESSGITEIQLLGGKHV